MAGIFDIFKPAVPAATTPATPPVPDADAAAKAKAAAEAKDAAEAKATPKLEDYAKIWEVPKAEGTVVDPTRINLDPAKLQQALQGKNLVGQIDPNVLATVLGDDKQAAATALVSMLNNVAINLMTQNVSATKGMVETALGNYNNSVDSKVASITKSQAASNALFAEMPSLNNPAIAPMLEQIKAGLTVNNPTWTADQVAAETVKFFKALSSAVSPAPAAGAPAQQEAATDWSKFF